MIKKRIFFIFFFALFLNFYSVNKSFSIEDTQLSTKYPDYSYEFVGKDPWEKFNRKIFAFNLQADKYILRPINVVWSSILPQYAVDRIQNFYTNLSYPVRLASCLLQKDTKASKTETVRFFTNTTIGLAGLYDPAKDWLKIYPADEDMGQTLAYYNVKQGNFLVLPIIAQGSMRDLYGKVLNLPFDPTSYIVGPVTTISTGVSFINKANYMQPIYKMIDNTYADPYEVTKQLYGIERYIKNKNLDRPSVFNEKTETQGIMNVSNIAEDIDHSLNADVKLSGYHSQGPLVDSMRSMYFDNKKLGNSIWPEMSIWNKNFDKKIKTGSARVDYFQPKYKYRYILQKDKNAPLAIIYPSIGEGRMSNESTVQAKILYDEGYSVLILGSPFQWEFVKSMPDGYKPGLPYQDAYYMRLVTSKILFNLQIDNSCIFKKKIVVGTSFGALTSLFVAQQEQEKDTLGVSNYIVINPPIKLLFALKQLDKYCQEWKKDPSDLKMKTAITAQKILNVSYGAEENEEKKSLPFTEEEAQLAIGFIMKQKLSDVVFVIEKCSRSKKTNVYEKINNMSFYDYAEKYLLANQKQSFDQIDYNSSLYTLADFLKKNNSYKIYHSLDDCFVNQEQLIWLKKQTGNKSVYFSNGSHLGFLYRDEFIDNFKKEIDRAKK